MRPPLIGCSMEFEHLIRAWINILENFVRSSMDGLCAIPTDSTQFPEAGITPEYLKHFFGLCFADEAAFLNQCNWSRAF